MVEVVAALIWQGDRFLACQRPAHKARGLLWEFVGGKVEAGETLQAALIRECQEELAVSIAVDSVFMEVTHEYPDITVHLTLFNSFIVEGEPQMLEHHDLAWITPEEIDGLAFCPADEEILKCLKEVRNPLGARLFGLADARYKAFQCKLIPDVSPECVLGVRFPQLRKLCKQLQREPEMHALLSDLPHKYYEENNLHALCINELRDYSAVINALEQFLPYVDNWSTCDTLAPKIFRKCPEPLLPQVARWMQSEHSYTRRFGISVLMRNYLEAKFQPELMEWVLKTPHDEYYVRMMVAWYFATALAKQYDAAVVILEKKCLDPWTHNKTIQKALESYRISAQQKAYLRTLKISQKKGNCYDEN